MGLSHSHLKLQMSKNQTGHVACIRVPSSDPSVSHHSLVPKLGRGKPGNCGRLEKAHPINGKDSVANPIGWSSPYRKYKTSPPAIVLSLKTTHHYLDIKLMIFKYRSALNADSAFGVQSLPYCKLWLLLLPPFKCSQSPSFDNFFRLFSCSLYIPWSTSPCFTYTYSHDYPILLIIRLNQQLPKCLPPAPASGFSGNWWANVTSGPPITGSLLFPQVAKNCCPVLPAVCRTQWGVTPALCFRLVRLPIQ